MEEEEEELTIYLQLLGKLKIITRPPPPPRIVAVIINVGRVATVIVISKIWRSLVVVEGVGSL